jgi:hypothetical protein
LIRLETNLKESELEGGAVGPTSFPWTDESPSGFWTNENDGGLVVSPFFSLFAPTHVVVVLGGKVGTGL